MKKTLLAWLDRLGPLLALIVVILLFAVIGPEGFFKARNLETIARQTAIVGIAALGMTLVIISGGIDLSVGSMVALATVLIATFLQGGGDPLLAAAGGVLIVALCGILNGLLITRLKVVPFIVTLGTLLIIRGLAKEVADEQKVDAPRTWLFDLMSMLPPDRRWMLFPPAVWLMFVLAGGVAALLRYTRLGRHIVAVGSNEETARLCGVGVEKVKLIVYSLGAFFAGLAGLMQFSRLRVGDPTVAVGLELNVIAAVVIGGGSLGGGEGTILGTLVGAFIMTVISTGLAQMGMPNHRQEIVTGCIIIIAVALDRLRHRRMS